MNHIYTVLALDIANRRTQEAAEARRAALAREGHPSEPGVVRRGFASGLAVVRRASTTVARRLDGGVADDRRRTLATGK